MKKKNDVQNFTKRCQKFQLFGRKILQLQENRKLKPASTILVAQNLFLTLKAKSA